MPITLRFYAELNELLPAEKRAVRFDHDGTLPATVESVLEELGVPGAEVDLVLANGESVALSRVLEDGDDLAVYPPFARVDVAPLRREARRDVAAGLAVLLVPVLLVWLLPQTLAGSVFALWRRVRPQLVRFGPLLCLVVPARGPGTAGISLGLVAFAEHPSIVRHELCHVITGLWLGWLYLPVYGLEYLVLGHRRSWHERITCWLEGRVRWPVRRIAMK